MIHSTDENSILTDSLADFGTIPAQGQANNSSQPYFFYVSTTPTDTILDFTLMISATGYNTFQYLAIGLNGSPGVGANFNNNRFPISLQPKLECVPNPFTKSTLLRWQIPVLGSSKLDLRIFDATGRLVTSLKLDSRTGSNNWEGLDRNGKSVPKGLYFLVLTNEKNKIIINKKVIRAD